VESISRFAASNHHDGDAKSIINISMAISWRIKFNSVFVFEGIA